jgi:subtilisin family serine protease
MLPRLPRAGLLALAVLAVVAPLLRGSAAAAPARSRESGQILVRFRAGSDAAARAAALRTAGVRPVRPLRLPRARVVHAPPRETARALTVLRGDPAVAWAEPNRSYRPKALPDDPRFREQWGLQSIGQPVGGAIAAAGADIRAAEAWDRTTGSRDVTVAILDSGIAMDHPDLAANIFTNPGEVPGNGVDDDGDGYADDVHGWDFFDADADPYDISEHAGGRSHGTHTAGIVGAAANNGIGIAGIAWQVGLAPLRICGPDGACPEDAVIDAMVYAGRIGADVANVSFGAVGLSAGVRDAMRASPDTLFVAAAGNDNTPREPADNDALPQSPCGEPVANVICVAATGPDGAIAPFSNFGDESVDLGAPGVGILGPHASLVTLPPAMTEGFEEPLEGRWTAAGGPGAWGRSPQHAALGSFSVADSPEGPYAPATDSTLTTVRPLDLTGQDGCVIAFRATYDTEPFFDFLILQTSTDGTHWGPPADAFAASGQGSGRQVFTPRRFSDRAGGLVRLRLVSDADNTPPATHDGAYVDDLSVTCAAPAAYTGNEFRTLDGTSFAAPFVSGVAALVESIHPQLAPAQVRRAIMDGVQPEPSLARTTVSGGRLSAIGALAAADRIVSPPPPPSPAPPEERSGAMLCAPVPPRRHHDRGGAGRLALTPAQLRINQRIAQAAMRRANAIERWLDAGVAARDLCGGAIGPADLGPGVRTAARAGAALEAAHPRPVADAGEPRHPPARVRLTAGQLLINQRISQSALRRLDALDRRLDDGLTDADIREGAITAGKLASGLAILAVDPATAAPGGAAAPAAAAGTPRPRRAVTLSLAQLRINQRIAQAAVRRANALGDRLARGLTGADIRDGSITPAKLEPALRAAGG